MATSMILGFFASTAAQQAGLCNARPRTSGANRNSSRRAPSNSRLTKSSSSRRAPSCRAVLESDASASPQASRQAAELASEPPPSAERLCCCTSHEDEQGTLQEVLSSSAASGGANSSQSADVLKLILAGALVALPVAFLALNSSVLPFDVDDIQDWLDEAVYFASHEINHAVNSQLGGAGDGSLGPTLLGLVFGAGLVTSFAPCTLSVLPLTIGYIAGFNNDKDDGGQSSVLSNALFFSLGLATTFSALGITAALAGKAYGQMGPGLPIAVSAVTMYMGLNLLGLAEFRVPSLFANFDPKEAAASLPGPVQMFLGGMTFALLASPCSTPVLASLLGYVASSEDVVVGFALLLAYTFGRVMPVLVAASFTGSMKQLLSLRQYSRWVNPASGALLLGIGTFSILNRVFPEATAMAVGMGPMGGAMGHM